MVVKRKQSKAKRSILTRLVLALLLSIARVGADLLVVPLERGKVLTSLRELTL